MPDMIIHEIVRFISSTQPRCGCLKLLIANACMMGIDGLRAGSQVLAFQFA